MQLFQRNRRYEPPEYAQTTVEEELTPWPGGEYILPAEGDSEAWDTTTRGVTDSRLSPGNSMTRARPYTEEEFECVLQHPELSAEELSRRCERSCGAIDVVRGFTHSYHMNRNVSGLSQMMVTRLAKGQWTCAICRQSFPSAVDPKSRGFTPTADGVQHQNSNDDSSGYSTPESALDEGSHQSSERIAAGDDRPQADAGSCKARSDQIHRNNADEIAKDQPVDWTARCPVCHENNLERRRSKGFLGLGARTYHHCSRCGALFVSKGRGLHALQNTKDDNNQVWRDYHNQALREDEWARIARGGLSDAKQHDLDIATWLTHLFEGRTRLPSSPHSHDVMLQEGEEVCMRFTKIRLYEPRSVTTTLGGYAGPTIRLGQGMSFRVGGFASRSTSHDEVQPIDSGVLILTTKRLVFVGPQRNASIDLTKIVAVQPYGDAIRVATTGRQKPQYYVGLGPKCLNMNLTVNGRSYHEPISGPILHMIIEALAQRLR